MDIHVLLLLTVVGIILVTIGLLGLYVDVNRRIKALKRSVKNTQRVALDHDSRISVIEQRDRDASDHIYIHNTDKSNEIQYGGKGI